MERVNATENKLFHQIKAELLTICEQIQIMEKESLKEDGQSLRQRIGFLDHLARQEISVSLKQAIQTDPQLQPCLRKILQVHRSSGIEVEMEACQKVLVSSDPWETLNHFHYLANYQALVKREGSEANLKAGDKVTFLGSGPLPLTLIVLQRLFQIQGLGLEINPERAEISRQLLDKLGLGREIQIVTGNEDSLDTARDSHLIMIAAFAEPIKRIFQRLSEIVDPETLVSYRVYEKGMRALFSSQPLNKTDLAEFVEIKRIPPEGTVNNTIVFLRRRQAVGKRVTSSFVTK